MLWLVLAWPHVVPPFGSMTTCASTLNSQGVNLPRELQTGTLSAWLSSWCLSVHSGEQRLRKKSSHTLFKTTRSVLTYTVVAPDVVVSIYKHWL